MIRVDPRLGSYNAGIHSMMFTPDMYKNIEISCFCMVKDSLKGLYASLSTIVLKTGLESQLETGQVKMTILRWP